ncbi:MAG: ABC transporter ATP-binding protein [Flavisolibacter sp.]
MLELKNINKSYHSRLVLEKDSLQLDKGIYWVKGANGSGKTTLLKMIAGLLPFEGDIIVDQTSQKKSPVAYRQKISWAEAEPLYPSFLSGNDLILLYRNIHKVDQKDIDKIVEILHIVEYISDKIGTYSAGMTKKLSLALAFIGNVRLCLLDEPLITLDTEAIHSICEFIIERHKNTGTSFLMSSHQDLNTQILLSEKELIIANQTITINETGR